MTPAEIAHSPLGHGRTALAGIAMMVLGIFLFSVNDALGKWLVATYSVGQVVLIRSLAATAALAPFVRNEGLSSFLRAPLPGLQILRVILSTGDVALFYWAVAYLPLADVMTYYMAGPIYVTALSPLLLGERVGWQRWTAVAVGFFGVLVALEPSTSTLTLPALVALAGSLSFALLMITTRKLRGTSDTALVSGQTLGALLFGCLAVPFSWVSPTLLDLVLLSLLGLVALVAHLCVNRSLKLAPASVVVPYQYMLIVWAVVFGYLVFGDVAKPATLIGAGIIVGAGLFIFLREQRHVRAGG
jgi:drug/metabolite transporter (DMT)-like permease